MLCVVVKVFNSDRPHAVGDIVDASGWRWADRLIEQRYLRRATDQECARGVTAPRSKPSRPRVSA